MATTERIPELPFKTLVLAAATGSSATPSLLDLTLPEAVTPHLDRWIAADLSTKGVHDITGSLAWWKATLRQLDAELAIAQEQEVDTP